MIQIKIKKILLIILVCIVSVASSINIKNNLAQQSFSINGSDEAIILENPSIQKISMQSELNNKPKHFFGANHADLIWTFIWPGSLNEDGREIMQEAAKYNISVIRYSSAGYYEWQTNTWLDNPSDYWSGYDSMINLADDLGLYLVPTLLWNPGQFSDVVGEAMKDVFEIGTDSNLLFKSFVTDLVTRYKNENCILYWEIANEPNLFVEPRTDYFTVSELQEFMNNTANFVRALDEKHPIASGNAGPPIDICPTLALGLAHFEAVNQYVDIATIHGSDGIPYGITEKEYLSELLEKCEKMNLSLVIGELAEDLVNNPRSTYVLNTLNAAFKLNISVLMWEWMVDPDQSFDRTQYDVNPIKTPFMTRTLQQFSILARFCGNNIAVEQLVIDTEEIATKLKITSESGFYFIQTKSNSTIELSDLDLTKEEFLKLRIRGVQKWNNITNGFLSLTIPKEIFNCEIGVIFDNRIITNELKTNETYYNLNINYTFFEHVLSIKDERYILTKELIANKTRLQLWFLSVIILTYSFFKKSRRKKE